MSKSVHITALEIENVKRVRAVALSPSVSGLTVVGGRNGQGKTSVLDAIMWTLCGDRFRPSDPVREGAEKAATKITLSNGVTVERKGVNGSLKVTSADGKGGQALLNQFVSEFALDLPRFMGATDTEKATMLLDQYPDLGPALQRIGEEVKAAYDERHALGVVADRKAKYAAELPYDAGAPDKPLSGAEMAGRLQAALQVNARNAELRRNVVKAEQDAARAADDATRQAKVVADLEARLEQERERLSQAQAKAAGMRSAIDQAKATADTLVDEDTTAVQREMEQIDSLNARVRANESKRAAEAEADHLREQYAEMTTKIEELRAERTKLLAGVSMPLPDLSISEEGRLVYRGQQWDCMSGAEQLRVATAICASVKPECGFVLLDKLEAMDAETLREFAAWLESRDLQAIGTRVSTGDECSIIIEDGVVVESVKKGIEF